MTGLGCGGHDCGGSQKWALHHYISDKDLLRSTFIAMASLKNGWDHIQAKTYRFITDNYTFVEPTYEQVFEHRPLF